jgi:hypothetical protein
MKDMLRALLLSLLVLGLAFPVQGATPPGAPSGPFQGSREDAGAAPQTTGGARVLSSDEDGVVFEVAVPAPRVSPAATGAFQDLTLDGYTPTSEPGRPVVPSRGWLLGVPPGAQPRVSIEVLQSETLPDVHPAPAVREIHAPLDPTRDGPPDMPDPVLDRTPDPAVYAQDAFWPAAPAALDGATRLRDLNTVTVRVFPVQVNPLRGEARVARRLRVTVSFDYPQGRPQPRVRPEAAGYLREMARDVLNWDSAQHWLDAPAAVTPAVTPPAGDVFRIAVNRPGIYQLTYSALVQAGFPSGQTINSLFMTDASGAEMRVRVIDQNANSVFDGSGGVDDVVLFWGDAVSGNKYSAVNTYWLGHNSPGGLRMTDISATPATGTVPTAYTQTVYLEQNRLYRGWLPLSDATDHWYWDWTLAGATSALTYSVTLANRVANTPVTVRLKLMGSYFETNQHTVQVKWNNQIVASNLTWTGDGPAVFAVTVPGSVATSGVNTMIVNGMLSGGAGHYVFTDNFLVSYRHAYSADSDKVVFSPDSSGAWKYQVAGFLTGGITLEAYDVGNPLSVGRIVGGTSSPSGPYTYTFQPAGTSGPSNRYVVQTTANRMAPLSITHDTPSTLHADLTQTDYILIVADSLANTVAPLAAARQAQGYTVRVIKVQDVYDEFSGGVISARAIKDFLAWAYANWTAPAPQFVVLFGDGTFDPQGYCLGGGCSGITGQATLIPPWLTASDPNMGETAADHCYVANPCGYGTSHALAFMHLGRIPAKDATEATTIVNKLVAYVNPPPGAWQSIALETCDNGLDENGNPDFAGNFYLNCIAHQASIEPYLFLADCDYYTKWTGNRYDPCYYYNPYGTDPDQFTDKMVRAINSGATFVTYTGHSHYLWVAHEHLWDLTDVDRLTNTTRPIWWVPMTCYEGYYVFPGVTAVSEKFLFAANGGSIGSFSPTGQDVVVGHEPLRTGMTNAIFTANERELGVLADAGKAYLWTAEPIYQRLVETYMLIGDPAASLAIQPVDHASLLRVLLPAAVR